MMTPDRASGGSAGFTLMELMIALALTGVLCMVAYASLDLSIKAMLKGQNAAADLQEIRVSQAILERSLSSAAPVVVDKHLYFIGDSRQMQFFTAVPLEAHTLGGIFHWRILIGKDKSGAEVLAVEQTRDVNWLRDPGGVEVRQILIGNLTTVDFSYGRGGEGYTTWDAKKAKSLPDWAKITFSQRGHQAMILLIPLYVSKVKIKENMF
jgi:prepilin-type N-terminal cleavage/methylation domain-containing protein